MAVPHFEHFLGRLGHGPFSLILVRIALAGSHGDKNFSSVSFPLFIRAGDAERPVVPFHRSRVHGLLAALVADRRLVALG